MIKLKVNTRKLENLVRQLKNVNNGILIIANDTINDLDKVVHEEFESSVDDLVYSQYKPLKYQRTMHLRGRHGAIVKEVVTSGANKKFEFKINENSRDPSDGQTWREKANRIESGQMRMSPESFGRPFIEETQRRLEWQLRRSGNDALTKMKRLIRKVGR